MFLFRDLRGCEAAGTGGEQWVAEGAAGEAGDGGEEGAAGDEAGGGQAVLPVIG